MYLIECANAYLAATQMQQKEMDYQTAYALLKLRKGLQTQVDFYQSEEMKLVERYAKTDKDGKVQWDEGNRFSFNDEKKAREFYEQRKKLSMTQIDDVEPVKAPKPEKISPAQLEALEKFIHFGEE